MHEVSVRYISHNDNGQIIEIWEGQYNVPDDLAPEAVREAKAQEWAQMAQASGRHVIRLRADASEESLPDVALLVVRDGQIVANPDLPEDQYAQAVIEEGKVRLHAGS